MRFQLAVKLAQLEEERQQDTVIMRCVNKKETGSPRAAFKTASHCINLLIFCTGEAI